MIEYLKTLYISSSIKSILDEFLIVSFVIFGCYVLNILLKKYFIKTIKNTIQSKSKPIWFKYKVIKKPLSLLFYIIPGFLVYLGLYYTHVHLLNQTVSFVKILTKITKVYLIYTCLIFTTSFLSFAENIYSKYINAKKTHISIKSILDVVKIILWILVSIVAFAIITDTPLANIFAGIGAIGAVVAFIFQDTIKNFTACMQIMANDLVHVGDWIEIPGTKANGIVKHISFNMIQIENFDKTIITLPTQILISAGLINSNNIIQSGNRKINQVFTISTNNIIFISEKEFDILLKNKRIANILGSINYDSELTNLELFRKYIYLYLKSLPTICKKSFILVRLSEMKEDYLSFEICAATHVENIILYEDIKAKIVENFISVLESFDMKIHND